MGSLILKHLSGESIGRFPVWIMRQAGRYLPRYRQIRKQHSFWEMVTTPDLACEVSCLPLNELDVDAAIFFSDILSLPYGMGVKIEMRESVGPVIDKPWQHRADFEALQKFQPQRDTRFVGDALSLLRRRLPEGKLLIGFAGAPWTVACYLIEGRGKSQFLEIKKWLWGSPADLTFCLHALFRATKDYLNFQLDSGAQALQLFDTWLSEMPVDFFSNHYLPLLNELFDSLKPRKAPLIFYSKSVGHLLPHFEKLHMDVLSVDHSVPLDEADAATSHKFCLQGNLDPAVLLSDEPTIRKQTRSLVECAKRLSHPAILNLGHGILPMTPVENARVFIEEARALWI